MVYFPASGFSHPLEESARTYTPELSRFFQRVEGSGHELTYREHSSYRLGAKARRLASMAHAITIGRNTKPRCASDWVAVTNCVSPAEPCPACATISMPILLFGDYSRMILNISGSATPVPVPCRIRAVINA